MPTGTSPNRSSVISWKYDVFLSFREEDTGKSFTDHLYHALNQEGIKPFRDEDQNLASHNYSSSVNAIEESRFAIIVLSKKYPVSTRLLDQLVKILELKNKDRLTVIPVFYHVDPAHLRRQLEECGKIFAQHEQDFQQNIEKVNKWKSALTEVASVSGWDLKDRHESGFIKEIVGDIFRQLKRTFPCYHKDFLVGMDSRMDKMESLLSLDKQDDDVRTVGICGERGIGKTTLAGEVFKKIHGKFDSCAFIDNVREECEKHGMPHLQQQLYQILLNRDESTTTLKSKKVLIILDDVDQVEQIETLVGKWRRQDDCLRPGSRVIVTTTKNHLLSRYGEGNIYEVDKLNNNEALQLLRRKAFKDNCILDDYIELCNDVVEIAEGHPLTLQSMASFLFGRTVDEWSDTIAKLKKNPTQFKSVLIDLFR
ncbi:disease resistance protein RPV1-like [Ziziphus jujuba]|uniref:Disease resistance protein RPV1-like n=1 Tax=Ziziphus jujuba TaxID=326968 RepID=A0A6P4ALI1_ZIZJJ|nr:disease resistance protein RPV1-like [Ziziphus jujuba]